MTNDGNHTYTYDAEGNITAVDNGSTAQYVYDALNQRVSAAANGTTTEYVFNAAGQRVSEWNGSTHAQLKGKYYWGGKPVAYYTTAASGAGASTHFEYQDWLGTERVRTTYNGGVEGTFASLPFGDGQSSTGVDTDANHYAMLDHDTETDTDHAQSRQYSNGQGHWLSPDPYDGSYDPSNPQSFNRYVYAMNSPLSNVDPSGLQTITSIGSGCYEVTTYVSTSHSMGYFDEYGNFISTGASEPTQQAPIVDFYCLPATLQISTQQILSQFPITTGGGGGAAAPNNGTPQYPTRMFGTHWCGPEAQVQRLTNSMLPAKLTISVTINTA